MAERPKTLPPVRPNVGLEHSYQRRLEREIAAMQHDVTTQIFATWRENTPTLAQDASSAADLQATMRRLGVTWRRRFSILASEMARHFATAAAQRVDAGLRASLAKAGMSVRFTLTPAMRDALAATTNANVALIKSIPAQHLADVSGDVMRSIQTGRDLGQLARALTDTYGVTKRRAAFIAKDQNDKATATITRVRQVELGLQAAWLHSAGGKTPRKTHVANSGNPYDPKVGWLDPAVGYRIFPGSEPGCRCVSRSIVPGLS